MDREIVDGVVTVVLDLATAVSRAAMAGDAVELWSAMAALAAPIMLEKLGVPLLAATFGYDATAAGYVALTGGVWTDTHDRALRDLTALSQLAHERLEGP